MMLFLDRTIPSACFWHFLLKQRPKLDENGKVYLICAVASVLLFISFVYFNDLALQIKNIAERQYNHHP